MTLSRHIGPDGKIIAPNIGRVGPVPVVEPLPDIASLSYLADEELFALLSRFDVLDDLDAQRILAEDVANRLMRIPGGTGEFEAQMDRLLESSARRVLVGMARRTQERWQTLEAIDGDFTAELIRVSEGDDHVCENCQALAGAIGTLADHESIGLPGTASCLGGDYCRCQLVRIS